MNLFSSQFRPSSHREQRELHFALRDFFNKKEDQASKFLRDVTNPEAARERTLIDDQERLRAFREPNIFTDPVNAAGARSGGIREFLLSMEPVQRLQEFRAFLNKNFPLRVQQKYSSAFSTITQGDVLDYKNGDPNGRIRVLLDALSIINGDTVDIAANSLPFAIARDAMQELNNNVSTAPGLLTSLYEQWRQSRPELGETQATTPSVLLQRDSGIDPRLRGALQNLVDEGAQRELLKRMFNVSKGKELDANLANIEAKSQQLNFVGSIEKRKIEQQGRGFIENFTNADPRLQIVSIAVGGMLAVKLFNSSKPFQWATYGLAGYFAYDRFVNGNENALDDIGKGIQTVARKGGDILKNLAFAAGLPVPRNEQERFDLIAEFLSKNRRELLGTAQNGLTALSNIRLENIAMAFTANPPGADIGGRLSVEGGESPAGAGYGGYGADAYNNYVAPGVSDPAGNMLGFALKTEMDRMGLTAQEKRNTFDNLKQNNGTVGKSIAHIMYLLGATKTDNIKAADEIDDALPLYGNSYDRLPADLKAKYMKIVRDGQKLALTDFKNKSFIQIVADLNVRKSNEAKNKIDTAADIPNPRTPGRRAMFNVLDTIGGADVEKDPASKLLADGGVIALDIDEFLRNGQTSSILAADGATELRKAFDTIRRGTSLTQAIEAIEKLKYAILVQSTRQETPLTKIDIVMLAGDTPNDVSATSALNYITGLLGRISISIPGRGFGAVSSLGDIQSLLKEPIFGTGAVASEGGSFDKLSRQIDAYKKRITDFKNPELVSKQLAERMPASAVSAFGGDKKKMTEFLQSILKDSDYVKQIDTSEKQLSQRMANELARTMRLTDTVDGVGRFDTLGITPTEQKNLGLMFDELFRTIIADPTINTGTWMRAEGVDTMKKTDMDTLRAIDFTDEKARTDAVNLGKNLGMVLLLNILSGTLSPELERALGERLRFIYDSTEREYKRGVFKTINELETEIQDIYRNFGTAPAGANQTIELPTEVFGALEYAGRPTAVSRTASAAGDAKLKTSLKKAQEKIIPLNNTILPGVNTLKTLLQLLRITVAGIALAPTTAPAAVPGAPMLSILSGPVTLPAGSTLPVGVLLPSGVTGSPITLPPGTVIPGSITLPAGVTAPAPSVLLPSTLTAPIILPPNVTVSGAVTLPPGSTTTSVLLPPGVTNNAIQLPPNTILAPGIALPAGVTSGAITLPPGTTVPTPILNNNGAVILPPGVTNAPASIPGGMRLPPGVTLPGGALTAPLTLPPNVTLPSGAVSLPPNTVTTGPTLLPQGPTSAPITLPPGTIVSSGAVSFPTGITTPSIVQLPPGTLSNALPLPAGATLSNGIQLPAGATGAPLTLPPGSVVPSTPLVPPPTTIPGSPPPPTIPGSGPPPTIPGSI